MTALAASEDVEAVLGRTLTADETARLTGVLAGASAVVRNLTKRKFEAGTYTVRRLVRSGKVILDSPESVVSVVCVNSDGTADTVDDYTLRGDTVYSLPAGWIEVEYTTAGTVPEELVGVVAEMAARKLTTSTPDGATSYTVTKGPFTESASFDAPTESVTPTSTERATILRYRLRLPAKSLL